MQSMVLYLRQNAGVIITVAVGMVTWPALYLYLEATTPKAPPRVQSQSDVIAAYGGCDEYLKAMRQMDTEMDHMMAEANLPGWREEAPIRVAERGLAVLKAKATCREMEALREEEVAAGDR